MRRFSHGARRAYAQRASPRTLRLMPTRRTALVSGLVAGAAGLAVAYAVFAWPLLLGASNLMLMWGWFGWLPAILTAYVIGSLAYRTTAALLERRPLLTALRSTFSVKARGQSFAGSKLGNVLAVVFLVAAVLYVLLAVLSPA